METSPQLPSATLTRLCATLISASPPITRGSRALAVCSGYLPGWFSKCVVQFSQDTSGISWLICFSTETQRKQRSRRKKRLWLLLTTAQLLNILPQGLTTGVVIGGLVMLQLHLLPFQHQLVPTGLLLQLLQLMVSGMQLLPHRLQPPPLDGNKALPLSRHPLLTGGRRVITHA